MTHIEDWLAANATVQCAPYRIRMTTGKCAVYQDRNPDACRGCERYRGGTNRPTNPHLVIRWYEEVSMEGIKDLFQKPAPKREIVKVQASVTTETKDRIGRISEETGYSIEKVCEAFILEGLKAYDEARGK